MQPVMLNFAKSTDARPNKAQNGKKFLLCWAGWQYDIATWVEERNDFYMEGGYVEDWTNPFVWAELPAHLKI